MLILIKCKFYSFFSLTILIKIKISINNLIEIISDNLNEGDQIVLEGLTKVQDGVTVKILD
jgi:hypothetical protein